MVRNATIPISRNTGTLFVEVLCRIPSDAARRSKRRYISIALRLSIVVLTSRRPVIRNDPEDTSALRDQPSEAEAIASTAVATFLGREIPAGTGGACTGWVAVGHVAILAVKCYRRKRRRAKSSHRSDVTVSKRTAEPCSRLGFPENFSHFCMMPKQLERSNIMRSRRQAARIVIP